MSDQRRSKRFEIQLPLEIQRAGSQRTLRTGRTRNISSGGVLFTSDSQIEIGGVIEYVLSLPASTAGSTVHLRCLGKVLRLEKTASPSSGGLSNAFAIAATLERYEFQRS